MMDPRHKQLLRRLRLQLCTEGLADGLAPQYLFQEGVITEEQLEDICSQTTSQRRTMKLLDILPTRGPKAFNIFLDSLTEFPWVRETLDRECKIVDLPPKSNVELTAKVLNSSPTDKQLNRLAVKLGSEWEQILMHLGLNYDQLYRCKTHHPYSVSSQVLEGLIMWRRQMGSKATIKCLSDALKAAEVDTSILLDILQ
ncbi:death domain-containing protein CRADD [Bombina bombina]|uniref:death domain-containing protein CRADD n=1 Tax=Bombina bombina TaxID=8345 RepID=UPI00235A53E1|nr:death domain-containing protein CRADD [Bombina bombina]